MLDGSEPIAPLVSQYFSKKGSKIRQVNGSIQINGLCSLPDRQTILAELEELSIANYGVIAYDLEFHQDDKGDKNFKVIQRKGENFKLITKLGHENINQSVFSYIFKGIKEVLKLVIYAILTSLTARLGFIDSFFKNTTQNTNDPLNSTDSSFTQAIAQVDNQTNTASKQKAGVIPVLFSSSHLQQRKSRTQPAEESQLTKDKKVAALPLQLSNNIG